MSRTKFSFSITLTEEQGFHFARLLRGDDEVLEPVTQPEMALFFAKCVRSALSFEVDEPIKEIGDAVLEDIDRGGWSLIGQPPSTKTIKRRH